MTAESSSPPALVGFGYPESQQEVHRWEEKVQAVSSLLPLALALCLCPSHMAELSLGLETLLLPITQEIYGWHWVPAVARFWPTHPLTGSFHCVHDSDNSIFIQFSLQSQ